MNTVKRLVALGDSITKGVIYDGERYSILPSGFVSQCAEDMHINIENYGRMGCTITRGTQIAEQHADAIAQSDATLVEFGGNDSDFCWTDIASAPADNHYPMTELPLFRQLYRDLIARIRQLGSKPILMTLPLIDYKRFYAFVTRNMGDQDQRNVLSWLGGQEERIRNYHDMYSLAVYQIGYQERVLGTGHHLAVPEQPRLPALPLRGRHTPLTTGARPDCRLGGEAAEAYPATDVKAGKSHKDTERSRTEAALFHG